ncbi:MAG: PIN-like domain-containing protein, partial [Tabrizicola sp.]
MKSEFPEYFPLTTAELETLWKGCMFAFDANTLLNLYRYSDTTRSEFLQVLQQMKGRVFAPEQ